MQQVVRKPWVNRVDAVELDIQLKQLLAILEQENSSVKSIIARLSKTMTASSAAKWRG